jgi:hypothetical protein
MRFLHSDARQARPALAASGFFHGEMTMAKGMDYGTKTPKKGGKGKKGGGKKGGKC